MKTKILVILLFPIVSFGQLMENWISMGDTQFKLNNTILAIESYTTHIETYPDDPLGYIKRAKVYFFTGQEDLANTDLQMANSLNPFAFLYIDPDLRASSFATKTYHYDPAQSEDEFFKSPIKIDHYTKVLSDLDAMHAQDDILLEAMENIQEKDFDNALSLLNEVNQNELNTSVVLDLRGLIEYKKGNLEEALLLFDKAIIENPNFPIAYHNRSLVYKQLGFIDLAKKDLKKAISMNSNISLFHFTMAAVAEKNYDVQDAIDSYDKALQIEPNYNEAMHNYTVLLKRIGEYDDAMLLIDEGMASSPNDPIHKLTKGNLHFIFGEFHEAEEAYSDYVLYRDNDLEGLYNLGLTQLLLGKKFEGCLHIEATINDKTNKDRLLLYEHFCEKTPELNNSSYGF